MSEFITFALGCVGGVALVHIYAWATIEPKVQEVVVFTEAAGLKSIVIGLLFVKKRGEDGCTVYCASGSLAKDYCLDVAVNDEVSDPSLWKGIVS